jgi:16S rRNA (adenine1518-N6/adenine1519-N6)-dimethyltransferase
MKQKKNLGQHWLTDRGVLREIADLAATEGVETALEIGPGLGTLTSALLKRFKQVVAVEYDADLAAKLPAQFVGSGLKVLHADILQFDLTKIPENYVVAGNIPYYITGPIVQKFLQAERPPRRMVLLVQKEVAERLAGVGGWSVLGLSASSRAAVSLGPIVGRELFTPAPKVDSQVVRFDFWPESRLRGVDEAEFWRLVKAGFKAPRKKLANNLSAMGIGQETLTELGLDAGARAEKLDLNDWINLYNIIKR